MKKKKVGMTPKERKARFEALVELGCLVCQRPPQIHHLRGHEFGCGMGLKSGDQFTIPLCNDHHNGGFSIHKTQDAFEAKHGTGAELLRITNEKIGFLENIS